jgi:hypothetical protein
MFEAVGADKTIRALIHKVTSCVVIARTPAPHPVHTAQAPRPATPPLASWTAS